MEMLLTVLSLLIGSVYIPVVISNYNEFKRLKSNAYNLLNLMNSPVPHRECNYECNRRLNARNIDSLHELIRIQTQLYQINQRELADTVSAASSQLGPLVNLTIEDNEKFHVTEKQFKSKIKNAKPALIPIFFNKKHI
ncbi:MAG: hypothetical protein WBB23_21740 [Desulforhopalus sp.]